ncbi:PaaI family thioesterase [Saccharopolyspora rhizosphaerae]|uniref:Acyl-coenzyme A thioesterase THEM4 n=1 Tax=Saccharopolyspora rhizosphaerae TaxID=2492662 RepID=A0A3R8VHE3_9PSEU|nr:PaaI family thioesterase [Saccharopolyspora rhizosphaerae]RRO17530.1 PaaI family thioesterase [Saccharopolyspora rhizosphaerae]
MTDTTSGSTPLPAAGPVPVIPEIPGGTTLLAGRVRELVEAGVLTDVGDEDLRQAAEHVAAATELLRGRTREDPMLLSYLDGNQVSVHNPVEGPGNPLAPPMVGLEVDGSGTTTSTALLSAAYEGPPGRVHGGWVASLLDHAVGRAVAVAGHPAMTVSLTVDYRRGTPHGVPLTINARFTGEEGRKVFATGEVVADGEVTAEARAILVTY